jgi:hypothetical protein
MEKETRLDQRVGLDWTVSVPHNLTLPGFILAHQGINLSHG